MKTLSKEECQAELQRLENIDGLEQELESAFDKVKDLSPTYLMSIAPRLLMSKANPLVELGLDPKLIDKAKLVAKANKIVREQRKRQLIEQSKIDMTEVQEGGEHENA
ncbi:hypothetical protein ACPV5U_16555 [Vibrio mediterranei]